jgi:hypothetical protein
VLLRSSIGEPGLSFGAFLPTFCTGKSFSKFLLEILTSTLGERLSLYLLGLGLANFKGLSLLWLDVRESCGLCTMTRSLLGTLLLVLIFGL